MLESFLDIVSWVDTAFTRTRDPVLAEYRNYQRHMILAGGLAVVMQLGFWLVMPTNEVANGFLLVVNMFAAHIAIGFLVVSAGASLWSAWAAYRLWRFTKD